MQEFTIAHPEIELPAETKRQVEIYRAYSAKRAASKCEWRVAEKAYAQALDKGYVNGAHVWFELAAVRVLGR